MIWLVGCKKDKKDESVTPQVSSPPVENNSKYTHEIDIESLLSRVSNAEGKISEDFLVAVSKPEMYYTDFYGYQALRLTSAENIKKDFIPKHAELVKEDENTLELKFNSGWTGKFYINTKMVIRAYNTFNIPVDHFYAGGATYQEFLTNLEEFRGIIKKEGLENRYLIANPDYDLEVETATKLGKLTTVKVLQKSEVSGLSNQSDAIGIYPDAHGDLELYEDISSILEKGDYDWFGMEMMSAALQPDIDTYLTAPEGSPAFIKSKNALLDYYGEFWNQHFKVTYASPEENHYFRLIEIARKKGKKVYGLEKVGEYFIPFRYGEDPFGLYVRNNGWAKNIPAEGKGVVFGGLPHFLKPGAVNFQEFVNGYYPGRPIYLLNEKL
jgi:hypothetical protein